MKGYLKVFATLLILLGIMFLIIMIISPFFPNADYKKMGSACGAFALVILFAMAVNKKKDSKGSRKKKMKLILALCVLFLLGIILSLVRSNRLEKNDPLSEQRINTFAHELTSMTERAKKYTRAEDMAFVIFKINNEDFYVQAASFQPGTICIDLPIQIMSEEKVKILRELCPYVVENYALKPNGPKELVSYQIHFQGADMQKNIHSVATAIEVIFLKVFGLKSDNSELIIKTETG